jgi:hypothetical protein
MWWYFTCKHVNMFHYFKIPYFTCTFFTAFIYNEYIGPYFLSHVVSKIFASELPEKACNLPLMNTLCKACQLHPIVTIMSWRTWCVWHGVHQFQTPSLALVNLQRNSWSSSWNASFSVWTTIQVYWKEGVIIRIILIIPHKIVVNSPRGALLTKT